MGRRNAFGHKTGRAGIKSYRAAGRMFGQTFSTGRGCPDVEATCCRCGGRCFVRSADNLLDGVTKVPCYGCVKEEVESSR